MYIYKSVIENLMQREVRTKKPFLEIFWCDDDQNPYTGYERVEQRDKPPPKRKFHTKKSVSISVYVSTYLSTDHKHFIHMLYMKQEESRKE
jgi:hypothetical protein